MKALIYRVEDVCRDLVLVMDYIVYLIFNPFKFKKFPEKVDKILLIELLQIGDLIVTTPVIKAIRGKYKEATIDILILQEMKEVLTGNKDLNRLIPYKDNLSDLIKEIKKEKYDLGIILHPGSFLMSLVLFLSGVKYRIGSTKSGMLYGKGFFLNKKIKPNLRIQHKIEDNFDVIKSIGIGEENKNPEIFITKESEEIVNDFLARNDIEKFIVIHPGANFKTHEWTIEKYAELADKVIKNYKMSVVFTGSRKDRILINNILRFMDNKAYEFSGKTIKDFFSIIKSAELVISVDTSANHIAAAFNKPIITLFGASNPDVWYPYSEKGKTIYKRDKCINCNKNFCFRLGDRKQECMRSITVKEVLNEVFPI